MADAPPDPDSTDIELMRRAGGGDAGAFRELVERHQHRVIGTVSRMLGGDRDSEDIAQQVFIRVWKSAPRYKPTAKFTTWLMTITRNLVFNETRRRGRARLVPMDDERDEAPRQFADETMHSPADELLAAELQDAIDAAIQALPEQQRMAVILRRYEEMPYDQIAVVLGTSVPAVKSILFRARLALRNQLAAWLGETGDSP